MPCWWQRDAHLCKQGSEDVPQPGTPTHVLPQSCLLGNATSRAQAAPALGPAL